MTFIMSNYSILQPISLIIYLIYLLVFYLSLFLLSAASLMLLLLLSVCLCQWRRFLLEIGGRAP